VPAQPKPYERDNRSALHGKPFPLQGVKDSGFRLVPGLGGRHAFLAAMGAESYKVEWKDNPDTRLAAMAPIGGRAARDAATGPLPGVKDLNMGGQFNNKNAGKRGISLNIRHPKGLQIAKDLVRICDVVAEGFSPGVLQRLGLGYDVLKSIRPDIIYIQQSGMGAHGTYGRMRTVGPVAAAFGGTGRHVRPAGTGDAGGLGLFLSRLDGRLRLRARAAGRDLSSGEDG
jgi:crotonobetainyl-CoA:carnitine CoA-transferase CaiB-like acyl-CoA transferase